MQWIIFPEQEATAAELGGKASALASLRRAALPIPDWFIVRPQACFHCLGRDAESRFSVTTDTADLQQLLAQLVAQDDLLLEIRQALVRLCPSGQPVAVRSSAVDEDSAACSFAGQLGTFLFVSPVEVFPTIVKVWYSGFSEQVLAYRRKHGLYAPPLPPAVIVQRMIHSDAGGVAFSADPVSGRRGISVISAVFGLGTSLVSGEANADTWHVDRGGKLVRTEIAQKLAADRPAPGSGKGVQCVPVPKEHALGAVLTDEQVRAVAALARHCAEHFGRPQDIEWAFESGRLYLLQSRPITSLATLPDPDGVLNIWDNSNIAESYGGITTPLTYSFARQAYEEVYRQFCRMMAVPSRRIAHAAPVFRSMIGLVRGRIYYNLLNWYRVLALLPGFTINRRFMEQMMGVREALPEALIAELQNASTADRLKDAFGLALSMGSLVVHHFTLQRSINRFYARLNTALRPPSPPLHQARPDELVACYLGLERQLLTRWDAPLVNDFLAMIFYGVLKKLTAKWCGDAGGTLQNNLLCGEGGMISAEPARRIFDLAKLVTRHPDLPSQLTSAPLDQAQAAILRVPEVAEAYQAYLDRFGDRCLEELKLESPTLHDDPTMLLRSIGRLALELKGSMSKASPQHPKTNVPSAQAAEPRLRLAAEAQVKASLRGRWFRQVVFGWVLRNARARVRDRENLRFERTRLFGRVRAIFVALGREFHARDLLNSPQDIFYLDLSEIHGFCNGTTTTADLRGLVALRRAEFSQYASMPAPPDRFETRGPVCHGNSCQRAATPANDSAPCAEWKGTGCSPGIVRGPVRVITDPRHAELRPGEILVAERTDPGWILLFASAAGLLVERGSLLSHSAIVSRELGLPSIVALPGITKNLADGDTVEMDGATGTVKRIPHD